MAKHEFGIMGAAPTAHERYDDYCPEKYDCIAIDDELIEPLTSDFSDIPCFWHTLEYPRCGLAYTGVTLIPVQSLGGFIEVFKSCGGCGKVIEVFERAEREGKFVIHFGV